MSVKVNLLPGEIKQRQAERRGVILLGLIVLAAIAAIAFIFFMKQGAVDDAIADRDAAQGQVNDLQAQVNSLQAFQRLANDLAAGDALAMAALADEIAVARLMNDVSLSLPSSASLTTLTLTREDLLGVGTVDLGDQVASLLLSGYSIERYAPGVEGVLLQFDQVTGLEITYLNTAAQAAIADVPVTSFDADGTLNDEIYTDRYAEGLPEVAQ